MKSLTMMAAGAALMVAAVGSSGCVLDWQSQGTITVHRERPALAPEPTPAACEPVRRVVVERPHAPPAAYAPRHWAPPVSTDCGPGREILVRNYRK